jgi:heme exporter protein C
VQITGYNTHYEPHNVEAWLTFDNTHFVSSSKINIQNQRKLEALFEIPGIIPGQKEVYPLNLIVRTTRDGISVLPNALFVSRNEDGDGTGSWLSSVQLGESKGTLHFPYRNILKETIRNTYYHVPLWMAMMIIYTFSMVYSVDFLRFKNRNADFKAFAFASTGTLFGVLGIVTGMIWAKNTWGAFWSFDVKQNMAAIALLIYAAYFILRSSLADPDVARRFASAYNVFAFILLIPLLFVIPRMTESLHPGSGGNPALASEDLDSTMRLIFYPAVLGWILIGIWISNLHSRLLRIIDIKALEY